MSKYSYLKEKIKEFKSDDLFISFQSVVGLFRLPKNSSEMIKLLEDTSTYIEALREVKNQLSEIDSPEEKLATGTVDEILTEVESFFECCVGFSLSPDGTDWGTRDFIATVEKILRKCEDTSRSFVDRYSTFELKGRYREMLLERINASSVIH